MNRLQALPGAKRLIDSLRGLGYECHTAIADLIDNSVAAGATEIHVEVSPREGSTPSHVLITDNGKGMSRVELLNAMRFGAFQEYTENDLGKYGLGLKTASLSQCRHVLVLSKPRSRADARSRLSAMAWDLDEINKRDRWELLSYDLKELKPWQRELLEKTSIQEYGTAVLWTGFDGELQQLESASGKTLQEYCSKLYGSIELHLRSVFHKFIDGRAPKRPKVNIFFNGNKLKTWDPFCLSEDRTTSLNPKSYSLAVLDENGKRTTHKITLYPYILPTEDAFSSREAHRDAAGEKGWNFQQGFYFYRNGRLLQSGGWSYLRRPDEHTKLIRIGVEFPVQLDKVFGLNVTKMRAKIPRDVRDEIEKDVSAWTKRARNVYDKVTLGGGRQKNKPISKTPAARSSQSSIPLPMQKVSGVQFAVSGVSSGEIAISPDKGKIIIPFTHPIRPLLDKKQGREPDFKSLCLLLFSYLELIKNNKMNASAVPFDKLKSELKKLS